MPAHLKFVLLQSCFTLLIIAVFLQTTASLTAEEYLPEDVWAWAQNGGAGEQTVKIFEMFTEFDKLTTPNPNEKPAPKPKATPKNNRFDVHGTYDARSDGGRDDMKQEELAKLAEEKLQRLKKQFDELKAEYESLFPTPREHTPLWKRAYKLFSWSSKERIEKTAERVRSHVVPDSRDLFETLRSYVRNLKLKMDGDDRFPALNRAYRNLRRSVLGLDVSTVLENSRDYMNAFVGNEIRQVKRMWKYVDAQIGKNLKWKKKFQILKRNLRYMHASYFGFNWQERYISLKSSPIALAFMNSAFGEKVRELYRDRNVKELLTSMASVIRNHFEANSVVFNKLKTFLRNKANTTLSKFVKELFSYTDFASYWLDATSFLSSALRVRFLRVLTFRKSVRLYAEIVQSRALVFGKKLSGRILVPVSSSALLVKDAFLGWSMRLFEFANFEFGSTIQFIHVVLSTVYSAWIILDKFLKGAFTLFFIAMFWNVGRMLSGSIVIRAALEMLRSAFEYCTGAWRENQSRRDRSSITSTSPGDSTDHRFRSSGESEASTITTPYRNFPQTQPLQYINVSRRRSRSSRLPKRIPIVYEEASSILSEDTGPRQRKTAAGKQTPRDKNKRSEASSRGRRNDDHLKRVEVRMVYASANKSGEKSVEDQVPRLIKKKSGTRKSCKRRPGKELDSEVIVIDD